MTPVKAEEIEVGFSPHAIAIDSRGNAWVGNLIGHPGALEKLALVKQKLEGKVEALEGRCRPTIWLPTCGSICGILSAKPRRRCLDDHSRRHGARPFNAGGAITGPWVSPSTAMTTSGWRVPPAIP